VDLFKILYTRSRSNAFDKFLDDSAGSKPLKLD